MPQWGPRSFLLFLNIKFRSIQKYVHTFHTWTRSFVGTTLLAIFIYAYNYLTSERSNKRATQGGTLKAMNAASVWSSCEREISGDRDMWWKARSCQKTRTHYWPNTGPTHTKQTRNLNRTNTKPEQNKHETSLYTRCFCLYVVVPFTTLQNPWV
jgi:hypothetical protein